MKIAGIAIAKTSPRVATMHMREGGKMIAAKAKKQHKKIRMVASVFLYLLFPLTGMTGAFRWYWRRIGGGSGIFDWPGP